MQKLRRLHLYLGCFFAPMLIFFAVSGVWQTFGWNDHVGVLKILSEIHMNHGHKGMTWNLSSPPMAVFATLMSVGLIFSVITGVVMAFKFGRGKITLVSLGAGIAIPLLIIIFFGHA